MKYSHLIFCLTLVSQLAWASPWENGIPDAVEILADCNTKDHPISSELIVGERKILGLIPKDQAASAIRFEMKMNLHETIPALDLKVTGYHRPGSSDQLKYVFLDARQVEINSWRWDGLVPLAALTDYEGSRYILSENFLECAHTRFSARLGDRYYSSMSELKKALSTLTQKLAAQADFKQSEEFKKGNSFKRLTQLTGLRNEYNEAFVKSYQAILHQQQEPAYQLDQSIIDPKTGQCDISKYLQLKQVLSFEQVPFMYDFYSKLLDQVFDTSSQVSLGFSEVPQVSRSLWEDRFKNDLTPYCEKDFHTQE